MVFSANKIFRVLAFTLVVFSFVGARAAGVEHIVGSTVGFPVEVHDALNAWLSASPPTPTQWYEVTFARNVGTGWLVSLVGVDAQQTSNLLLEDNLHAIWIGSVKVFSDGSVAPFNPVAAP